MDAQLQPLFELTQLKIPDCTFILTASEAVRKKRLGMRQNVNDLELNLRLQNQADRLFRTYGHPVLDTSDSTVEETVELILSKLY
jgi:dephospho-CoA kinase